MQITISTWKKYPLSDRVQLYLDCFMLTFSLKKPKFPDRMIEEANNKYKSDVIGVHEDFKSNLPKKKKIKCNFTMTTTAMIILRLK